MKIESTGWTVSDIFEGSDDTKIEIDFTGHLLTLYTNADNGTEAKITFIYKDFIALRHAMQAASGKAAELRGEQPPDPTPAPTPTPTLTTPAPEASLSPFDLMREQLAGWQESAAANHEVLEHRDHIASCCHVFAPGDIRAMINESEREYGATAATA